MLFPRFLFIAIAIVLTGCEDLNPSADDIRPSVNCNDTGPDVCQTAPEFSRPDTLGNTVSIPEALFGTDGGVLYFTMWCPICDSHMSHLRNYVIPNYPDVKFYIIDYVSGTVEQSRSSQISNGYTDMTVLVDNIQEVLSLYEATMGTTVVIEYANGPGIVRMNEDYKDGTKLIETLNALP